MGRGKSRRSLELIEASIEILDEIQPASVRAVCYRLFTCGLIPNMSKNETNKVSRQLTDAREAGQIPWPWIVDETREREGVSTWRDPAAFGRTVMQSYRRNKWDGQPIRIECWSEKSTVKGTLKPVLDAYEVDFRSVHGYSSSTAIRDLVTERLRSPKPLLILYVGDHDCSGMHMSEVDLPGRAEAYTENALEDGDQDVADLAIQRIALTAWDIADPGLPSFPSEDKRQDPRHGWYVRRYGSRCWELDAMSPPALRARVESAIRGHLDPAAWDRYVAAERVELASITRAVRSWGALTGAGA